MESCFRCQRTEEEIRLFDGIYVNEPVKICEACSGISGIPLIKRPSSNQLKEAEKPYSVRQRLIMLGHLKQKESPRPENKEAEKKSSLENEEPEKESLVFKLVDNFHWIIQTERRRKGLSVHQLAETIKESEEAIKLLEKAIVPTNSFDLIIKMEQFLKIKLIKKDFLEKINEEREKRIQEEIEKQKEEKFYFQQEDLLIEEPELNPLGIKKMNKITAKEELPLTFKKKEAEQFKIRDLQRLDEKIEKDFQFPKKTKEEVGKEQLDNFGKEDTSKINRVIFNKTKEKEAKKATPTIYELMKAKEEKERKSIIGRDILPED